MSTDARRRSPSRAARAAFGAAIVVHLVGLYAPRLEAAGGVQVPGADKVAHIVLFGAVMLTGSLAGIRARILVPVLVAHAAGSEVIQRVFLPQRSGDPLDALADLAGIAIGWYVANMIARHRLKDR